MPPEAGTAHAVHLLTSLGFKYFSTGILFKTLLPMRRIRGIEDATCIRVNGGHSSIRISIDPVGDGCLEKTSL